MKKAIFLFICLNATALFSQNCACDSSLMLIKKSIEDNYAGWFDKVTDSNRKDFEDWNQTYLSKAKTISSDSLCAIMLKEWAWYFKDRHIQIRFRGANRQSKSLAEPIKDGDIPRSNLTEKDILNYLTNNKNLDAIEGIYQTPTFKLGITKIKGNTFYATVLHSKNELWQVGEAKYVFDKKEKGYDALVFYNDKSEKTKESAQMVDNILEFESFIVEKLIPESTTKRDFKEYEILKDAGAPKLTFKDDVAVFSFPHFYGNSDDQIQYLLKKYANSLENTPYWVIDLRNNNGGNYNVGMHLMPYIYSKPILQHTMTMRVSENNYNKWRSWFDGVYPSKDTATNRYYENLFAELKTKVGGFYHFNKNKFDTIRYDSVRAFPLKIAILINERTVSSGELFTILAEKSNKVTVMGNNSAGMMDYGDIPDYTTPCRRIKFTIPMTRSGWLDDGISIDKEGIKPAIYLDKNDNDWIGKAISIIKKK